MNLHRNIGTHVVMLCAASMLVGASHVDAASSGRTTHLDTIRDRIEARMSEHRARLDEHVGRLHERVCERLRRVEAHWGIAVDMPWYCSSDGVLPTVRIRAADMSVTQGSSTTVSWVSTNATACTALGGGWSGTRGLSGSEIVTPSATTTYTMHCTNGAGSASDSVIVSVHAPVVPVPTQTPVVLFDASPHTVQVGGTSTLSWSTQYADTCSASGASDWTGTHATSGSAGVTLAATTTYVLTCSNGAGTSTASTTVAVRTTYTESLPSVDLSATPATVTGGGTSTLQWVSTDADTCLASGGWSGARATSGSEIVTLSATTTYVIACSNITGTATNSVDVAVNTPATPLGKVVISEVMYQATTSGMWGEWVELFNGTNQSIDLAGWRLSDHAATDTISTTSAHVVPAGGYALIIASSSTIDQWKFDSDILLINLASYIGGGLNDGGDALYLCNSSAVEQDAVSWEGDNSAFEASGLDAPAGTSIARIPVTVDTDTKNDWVALATPTPGS